MANTKKEKIFKATSEVTGMKEKVEIKNALPNGMIRVRALRDYVGMSDVIYKGDIFMLPERRYKTLAARGYVEEYDGNGKTIDKR